MEKKTTTKKTPARTTKAQSPSQKASAKKAGTMAEKACKFCCDCVDKACKAIDKPINTPSKREAISKKVGGGATAVVVSLNKMNNEFREIEQDCIHKVREFKDSRAMKKAERAVKN